MKIRSISHNCFLFEAQNGFKLLMDPWLTDGANLGSFFHFPPLATEVSHFKDLDALYLSSSFEDYFDRKVVSTFKKDLPIILLNQEQKSPLVNELEGMGFKRLIKVADCRDTQMGPFKVTLYGSFKLDELSSAYDQGLIHSSMVIEADGKRLLFSGENEVTEVGAQMLKNRHGKFDLVHLKAFGTSSYPVWMKMDDDLKSIQLGDFFQKRVYELERLAKILGSEWLYPFSGDFQLGGFNTKFNKVLALPAKKWLAERLTSMGVKTLFLNEGGSFDLNSGALDAAFRRVTTDYKNWEKRVGTLPYSYEEEEDFPSAEEMTELFQRAHKNLLSRQEKMKFFPPYKIRFNYFEKHYVVDLKEDQALFPVADVEIDVDERLLKKLLQGKISWQLAERGGHVSYKIGTKWEPFVSSVLRFFHQ